MAADTSRGTVLMIYSPTGDGLDRVWEHLGFGCLVSEETFSPEKARAEAAEQGRRFLVSLHDRLWGLPALDDAATISVRA